MRRRGSYRRDFLRTTAVTSAGLAGAGAFRVAGCGGSRSGLTDRQRAAVPVAERYFADGSLADARRIGEAYLAQAKPNRMELDALLDPTVGRIEDASESDAALAELEDALGRDFEDLRIVDVEGWTLGRTEVGLCALVALGASA